MIKQFPPDTSVHVFYTAIAQKYELRGIFYLDLWPFGPPQMILSTPETAEMVTVNSNYPMHDEVARFLGPLVGYKAIGSSDGPMWKMLHRMMAPSFRPSVITSMVPTIATQTMQVFHSKLAQFASDGETFSMQKLAGRLIFRISSKVFLGVALSDQMNEDLLHDMDQIMDYAQMLTLTSGTSPLKKAVKWWRKRMAARRIDTFLLSLIEKRQVALSRGGPESPAGEVDVSTLDRLLLEGQKMEIGSQRPGKPSEALVPLIVDKLGFRNIET